MYKYKAKILDIIDNNTLVVEIDLGFNFYTKQKLRFFGAKVIDAGDNTVGQEARKWMQFLIGSTVIITTLFNKRSKVGKTMGIVYTIDSLTGMPDRNINEELINRKYAIDYSKWDKES